MSDTINKEEPNKRCYKFLESMEEIYSLSILMEGIPMLGRQTYFNWHHIDPSMNQMAECYG